MRVNNVSRFRREVDGGVRCDPLRHLTDVADISFQGGDSQTGDSEI